ncbi:DnaJ-domain-containing protein [Mollisia scopiformis]|uniref:DnaJ-domain-containing protein n=1 Tax=Mollisia scopiformis TaxID=149040 RepID=A0A194XAB7_MOLSC|nr:DnaJ-domain-containing protein [Mollisia scopiformis]KUJ17110.1 DnaJ-domain-containing protein [Mollisia scopiformis]
MPQATATSDYYAILEIDQNATPDEITKSYKRLALLRHPDRNTTHNSTKAFQLLGEAYETLKDESKRRDYDSTYAQIKTTRSSQPNTTERRRTSSTTNSNPNDTKTDIARIAAIVRAKQERFAGWSQTQTIFNEKIFELKRDIIDLQSAIQGFEDTETAERAKDEGTKRWPARIFSHRSRKSVQAQEKKEQKERDRLQRLHSKTLREIELKKKWSEIRDHETLFETKRQEFYDANKADDIIKSAIEQVMRIKQQIHQQAERYEKEKAAREEAQRDRDEQFEQGQREAAREKAEREEMKMRREELAEAIEKLRVEEALKLAEENRKRNELQQKQEAKRRKKEQAAEQQRRENAEKAAEQALEDYRVGQTAV